MTIYRYLNGYRYAVGHTRADGYQEEITEYEAMEIAADVERERRRPRRQHDPEAVRRAFGDDPPW